MYIAMKTPWVRVHTWDPADEIRESKYTTEQPNLNCPAPTEGHRSSALPLREAIVQRRCSGALQQRVGRLEKHPNPLAQNSQLTLNSNKCVSNAQACTRSVVVPFLLRSLRGARRCCSSLGGMQELPRAG